MSESSLPDPHLLRDLRISVRSAGGRHLAELPAQPSLRNARGEVRASALATLVDLVAGGLALEAARPDWVVTSDLALHRLAPAIGDPVVAEASVLRRGRTGVVIEVVLRAGRDAPAPVASASLLFSRVEALADAPIFAPREPDRWLRHALDGSGFRAPLFEQLGIECGDAGRGEASLAKRPYLENSRHMVQGGAIAMLAEAAAETAAGAALGAGASVQDLALRFLAPGREGPLRAGARLLGGDGGRATVRVEVCDAGHRDALVAVATCTARA